ncbi:MAG: VanZ family protein [Dehalococcoidia bacterium]
MKASHSLIHRPTLRRGLFLYWLPALVFAAAISIGSSFSSYTVEDTFDTLRLTTPDQVVFHGGEFAIFALLSYRLLSFHLKWPFRYLAPAVLLLAAGYGAVDELHQAFVPGRDSSIYDVASDTAGALLALAGVGVILWLRGLRMRSAG